jgi:nucleoside phosphorylase
VILFLAAFPPELLALESHVERDVVGVGLVEAALGAARIIERRKPTAVVLVGTAGAYPGKGASIGDVVIAARVLLVAPAGALVPAMPSDLATDAGLAQRAKQVRRVTVATTLAITTDDEVARTLAATADVEHLEAFAVGRACQQANLPFTAVLGIANVVGSRGRAEWREHHERASAAACAVALSCASRDVRSPTTEQ